MKKEFIIALIVLIVIIVIILIILKPFKKKVIISDISKMHFSYSTGNAIYSQVSYDLKYEDNKYLVTIKPDQIPKDDAREFEIDENKVLEIINILKKYNVSNWNGFNKINRNVLDGNSFSFTLTTKSDEYISAKGYMRWPKNYQEVKSELNTLFMNIYNGRENE